MSYLEPGNSRFTWVAAATPKTSLLMEAGCVQCGSSLDTSLSGSLNLTGKCFNCLNWISDEDEVFEDFDG
jgi:hypothetical protein